MGEITKPMHDLLDIIRFTERLSAKIADISDEDTLYSVLDKELSSSPYFSSILMLTDSGSKLRFAFVSLHSKAVEAAERMTGFRLRDFRIDLRESRFFSQIVLEGKTVHASRVEVIDAALPPVLRSMRTLILMVSGIPDAHDILTPLYRHGNVVGIFSISSADLAEEFNPSVKSLARHIESVLERMEDLAERKRVEEKLRESEDRHRTLFETMAQGAVYQDANGRIISANPAAQRILGLTVEQMRGGAYVDPRWRAVHEDGSDFPGETRPSIAALTTGKTVRNVVMGVFNPQTARYSWMNITAVPQFRLGESKPFRVYTTFEDITERKDMERRLKESAENLGRLAEKRTEELREAEKLAAVGQVALMIGHDLRNPLQVLSNIAYKMRRSIDRAPPGLPESIVKETREGAHDVEEQIQYMDKIVSDLHDYAAPVEVRPVATEIQQLMADVLLGVGLPDSVKVSVRIEEDVSRLVLDPTLLRRVFANLARNASEAMQEGGQLTIQASQTDGYVSFVFKDTGVGIPEEILKHMFTPFFTTKARGAGLGLPVCKRLVEALSGEITIKSEVGKGTEVTVKVPLLRA